MDSIEQLIKKVKKGSAKAAEQIGLLESEVRGGLGVLRGEALTALVEALAHQSHSVRFEAAWALVSFRKDATVAVPSLVKLLKDPHADVRSQAADTLGGVGITRQFVPELVEALGADDAVIRQCAAQALGHIGSEARDAVPALKAALADSDRHVRANAAMTLGEIGADAATAVPSLFHLVLSEDTETQTYIVEALVSICQNSASATQTLRDLLVALGHEVRGSAAIALREAARA